MLEFIVLGHIPGTDIYLSFEHIALFSMGLILVSFTVRLFTTTLKRIKTENKEAKQLLGFVFARAILR